MISKTIKYCKVLNVEGVDDRPFFMIEFTDNSKVYLEGTYGGYTGESSGEYPAFIRLYNEEEFEEYISDFWEDESHIKVER